ncbi:hypothetical protein PLESTM_001217000 [Pleodorina starrii]|nr:hypothetical protein PLESTM_001217000 [Pleodorina starrii]
MPWRNSNARGSGGADNVLKHGTDECRIRRDKQRLEKELHKERALDHRVAWEQKFNKNAVDEDLMSQAHRLEDAGLLLEAANAYAHLLTRPDQFHNKPLRDHLAELVKRVNRQQAEAKLQERRAELDEEGRLWPGRPRGLDSPRERGGVPARGGPRHDKPVGPCTPMSPEAYRAELAAQAMDNRRRREEARKADELLEQKQVAIAAAMEALEQHRRKVVGGNDKLSYANEMDLERKNRQEDRRRQYCAEWDQLKQAGGPGVRQSYDLDELRRREQVQNAHAHAALMRASYEAPPRGPQGAQYHDAYGRDPRVIQAEEMAAAAAAGGGGGGAYHHRPASAAAARERNNAANFERKYIPGHPYAPPGGLAPPPPPQEAWPVAAAAAAVGAQRAGGAPAAAAAGLRGVLKSPYARPGVDKPHVRIDPQVVRSHQQAFIEKHRKPDPPPQQQNVPLRLRKEAARRPEQPVLAYGAAAASYGGAGWW